MIGRRMREPHHCLQVSGYRSCAANCRELGRQIGHCTQKLFFWLALAKLLFVLHRLRQQAPWGALPLQSAPPYSACVGFRRRVCTACLRPLGLPNSSLACPGLPVDVIGNGLETNHCMLQYGACVSLAGPVSYDARNSGSTLPQR